MGTTDTSVVRWLRPSAGQCAGAAVPSLGSLVATGAARTGAVAIAERGDGAASSRPGAGARR